jgi:Arc-like DNA binding dprotein
MARKPLDIANINLRIRESLRAKLAREAEKNRTSLNNEIRLRLEDSLEKAAARTLDDIAADQKVMWARCSNLLDLLRLETVLTKALVQTRDPEVVKLAAEWLAIRAKFPE